MTAGLSGRPLAITIYSVEPPREKKLDFEFGSNETTLSRLMYATSQSHHSAVPEAPIMALGWSRGSLFVWMMQFRHTCFEVSVLSWWSFRGGLIHEKLYFGACCGSAHFHTGLGGKQGGKSTTEQDCKRPAGAAGSSLDRLLRGCRCRIWPV